jgi:type IV secretion system protein VirD4
VKDRVAFILDEAARLGNMSLLEVARDAGRKYGIVALAVSTSVTAEKLCHEVDSNHAETASLSPHCWRCGYFTQEIISYSQQARTGKGSGGVSVSASTALHRR